MGGRIGRWMARSFHGVERRLVKEGCAAAGNPEPVKSGKDPRGSSGVGGFGLKAGRQGIAPLMTTYSIVWIVVSYSGK